MLIRRIKSHILISCDTENESKSLMAFLRKRSSKAIFLESIEKMKLDCFICGKKDLLMIVLGNGKTFHAKCTDCNILWVVRREGIYKAKNGIFWDKEHDMAKHGKQIVVKKKPKKPEVVTVIHQLNYEKYFSLTKYFNSRV